MRRLFVLESGVKGNENRLNRKNRKLAPEAVRRRAREQGWVPGTGDCVCLKNRGRALDLDQHHFGGRNRHRGRRMHRNAQRAMIGIGFQRMDVRNLHHGQKREQNQTYEGRNRQSSKPAAASPVRIGLKSCQRNNPAYKDTHYWIFDA
jgi:hypothetical protein